MEGNFKLSIKANNYLDNPTKENLEIFKEELKTSSSLSMAVVLSYLNNFVSNNQKITECKNLIELIEPKFEPNESKYGVYDSMLGEIIYENEEQKKNK